MICIVMIVVIVVVWVVMVMMVIVGHPVPQMPQSHSGQNIANTERVRSPVVSVA